MARLLKEGEQLVQIGVTALRAPNGDFLPSVPMYIIEGGAQAAKATGMTAGERAACDELVRRMADDFKAYMDDMDALERQRKKARKAKPQALAEVTGG